MSEAVAVQLPLFEAPNSADARGAAACAALLSDDRRRRGITFTPAWLVDRMLDRLASTGRYETIVDAGAGSGRFCLAAARRFPAARVVAVERSADMISVLRQNIREAGLHERIEIVEGDFRHVPLVLSGRTAFVGNPPFVRHHDIEADEKAWYSRTMQGLGQLASQLAGMHLHFMARAASLMKAGDRMCFVTSAEWLDNGYGSAWRALLTDAVGPLRLQGLWVAAPEAPVFPDALVSSLVFDACAGDASPPGVELGMLDDAGLHASRRLDRAELVASVRWSAMCQPSLMLPTAGIELGELFKVTRGQVTGLNAAWILPVGSPSLPAHLTLPAVTKAREIIDGTVEAAAGLQALRRVANLPGDLGCLPAQDRDQVQAFLERARDLGADASYVARQRRAWHALDLRPAPPVLVSYMGRRPPVFRLNRHCATFLNIAHGLYPRQPLVAASLRRMLDYLNTHVDVRAGRLYGGGLAKFEPSDIARLHVPQDVVEFEQ